MTAHIGTTSDGVVVEIDMKRIVGAHLAILANSGGGKTWCVRKTLEASYGQIQQIIIDPDDEYYTLREKGDYLLLGGEHGDAPLSIGGAAALALTLLEHGISAILNINRMEVEVQQEFVGEFMTGLIDAPRRLWHPTLIVIDEAHRFMPQDETVPSSRPMLALMSQGRKRGFTAVIASQRLAKLDKNGTGDCNNWLIGRVGQAVDRKVAADALGFGGSSKEARSMVSFDAGEFYAYGPSIAREPTLFKVGMVETTHMEAGQAPAPTPPAPDAMREIVAGLAKAASAPAAPVDPDLGPGAPSGRALEDLLEDARGAGFQEGINRGTSIAMRRVINLLLPALMQINNEADEEVEKNEFLRQVEPHLFLRRVDPGPDGVVPGEEGFQRYPGVVVGGDEESYRTVEDVFASVKDRKPLPMPEPIHVPHPPQGRPLRQGEEFGHYASEPPPPSGKVSRSQQRILDEIAGWQAVKKAPIDKRTLAFLADASIKSSTYGNNLGALRSAGLIEYPSAGMVDLTGPGRILAVRPKKLATNDSVQRAVLNRLSSSQQRIVEAVVQDWPDGVIKERLAERVGASLTSSTFGNNLGALRSLGVIHYPRPGWVAATDALFPFGR